MPDGMGARGDFRLAVFQGAAHPDPQVRLAALDRALAGAEHPQLVVCPELFLSGYSAGERFAALAPECAGPLRRDLAAIARRHGCAIAHGYPEADGGVLYNAAAVIAGDGRILANRRKMVLPTAYEQAWFRPGQGPGIFTLGEWQLALVICYEVEFPEITRACARGGAMLVVVPTALTRDWGVVSRKVVAARAMENGIFLAYANHWGPDGAFDFLGDSCIIGPDGADLARAAPGEGLIETTLDPALAERLRTRLPYLRDSEGMGALRAAPAPQPRDTESA